jgi:CheY-like chemotaxis protein
MLYRPAPRLRPRRARQQAMSSEPTILIVDDDLDNRWSYRELLEDCGYSVEEAGDGRKALKRLTDPSLEPPRLILLDLSMPLMDGWQMLAIMKGYESLKEIPVILCSANEPGLDPVCHGTIAAYLRKPCPASELLALVTKLAPNVNPTKRDPEHPM